MKGKKYTTEDKIRILRQADAGKSILDVCREHNIADTYGHGTSLLTQPFGVERCGC